MARKSCNFVKGAKSAWYCSHCDTHYSDICIPDGYNPMWGRAGPSCVLCHAPLTPSNDPSLQLPFWQVLPYLLIYPLHPYALAVLALGVVGVYLLGGGVPALVFAFVYGVISVKYLFAVVTERGAGRRWPPGLLVFVRPDPHWLFLQALLVYIIFAAAIVGAAFVHVYASLAVAVFVAAAYPASTILLASEKNLLHAVNPLNLLGLMLNMGLGPYVALWVLTAIVSLGPSAVGYYLYPQIAESWLLPAAVGVGSYFAMVVHALMGYALFQYRDELGMAVGTDQPHMEEGEFVRARGLGAVTVLEKSGDYGRARQVLRELLDVYRDDLSLHRHYQRILLNLDDTEALAKHTDYLAALLLQANQNKEAVALVEQALAKCSEYRVSHLATARDLARAMDKAGRYEAMVRVMANLHKRVPPDDAVAEVYARLAQALAGPLQKPDKARALAAFTVKAYPKAPQVRQLVKLARPAAK
ncbi:lipopolysaccharide assembly protein LapB [Gilvimarinus sp. DA14]|uniref:tetratricopeptide repeat protein n=1 Tax=Gilvimarinus sp. DA14 TaxID=2956798 RepID=UPI0020B6E84D|nr:hypothetical protein [Gilvimarinus sp. DA14]UTF59951.1 hypothetical protein NHM04_15990 [Gilvimarinus sp. DA14]